MPTCGKRKAFKVLGLIDYFSGRFFWQHQTARFTAERYQTFLQAVLDQTDRPILLLQDGAKYHTTAAIQPFFTAHRDRLTVYQFPGYSPDYNPIEPRPNQYRVSARHFHADQAYYGATPRPSAGRPDSAGDAIVSAAG